MTGSTITVMTSGGGSLAGRPSTAVSRRLPAGENGAALAIVLAVIPGTAISRALSCS